MGVRELVFRSDSRWENLLKKGSFEGGIFLRLDVNPVNVREYPFYSR